MRWYWIVAIWVIAMLVAWAFMYGATRKDDDG